MGIGLHVVCGCLFNMFVETDRRPLFSVIGFNLF